MGVHFRFALGGKMVRFKNRYLLVELVWGDGMVDSSISSENLKREVKHQIQLNFGDFGVGLIQATLQVKYWNHLTNLCIIRCARDYYKMVWAAVTMISTLNQRSVLFRLVHLGGSVRSCQKAAIAFPLKPGTARTLPAHGVKAEEDCAASSSSSSSTSSASADPMAT